MSPELKYPSLGASRLRILLYQFFPGGGIGRYTHELATALQHHQDLAVEVVCSPEYQFRNSASYPIWLGLMPLSSRFSMIRRSRFLIGQLINPNRLIQHARITNADVIHFSNINHLSFPFWEKKLTNLKCSIVATAHDVRRAQSILNRKWENASLQRFYKTCDAVLVHSEAQREDVRNFADVRPDRIHVVPHGPYDYARPTKTREQLRSKYGLPQDRTIALCFGSIRDDKNLDATLQAIRCLTAPPFVIIAGRGGGKGNRPVTWYRQRVQELGLESDVMFLDRYISDEEVGDLFHLSDVILLAYRLSFTSQSGVLNVAMHYHRPVVVTPSPTIAETVANYKVGIIAADDSSNAIAEAIDKWRLNGLQFEKSSFHHYLHDHSWLRNAEISRSIYWESVIRSGASTTSGRNSVHV